MDLISRQAAIDALKKQQAYFSKEDSPIVYYEYRHAIEAIKCLPSTERDYKFDDMIELDSYRLQERNEE